MRQPIIQVDAFTDKPFSGNPAAVCVLRRAADERWMQNVALEMNLSETAFLYPDGHVYNLRWFTPTAEVELCGHATLASAHVLFQEEYLTAEQQAKFMTKSGMLTAEKRGELIELNFPALDEQEAEVPGEMLDALGVKVVYVGMSGAKYLIEVESEETVRNLRPNFAVLERMKIRGIMVTSRASTEGFDFVSRYFAPGIGIREDPVTGSAHCCLGPYWKKRLGKDRFVAYQASARGGVVHVSVEGDRVRLGGHAVTVIRGELVYE